MTLHMSGCRIIKGQLLKGYLLIGATLVYGNQSNFGILWVMCAKGQTIGEERVQKGGSLVASHMQSWILKDVMPTTVLLSCQSS